MAAAKGFKSGSTKSGAASSGAREALELPEWVAKKIEDLKDTLRLAKSPAETQLAAKEYDEVMKAISTDLRINGRQVAPNAKSVTYDMGNGKFISRPRGEDAPKGGKAINLSEDDVVKLLPPRPTVPTSVVDKAEEVVTKAAPKPGQGPWGDRPAPPPAWSGYGSRPAAEVAQEVSPEAVQIAKETLRRPAAPWSKPQSTPKIPPLADDPVVPNLRSLEAGAIVPAAGAAGAMYFDPDAAKKMAQNILRTPYQINPNEMSPNPDNVPFMGPGVSAQPDDFRDSGLPYPQPQGVSFDQSDFAPNGGMMDGPITPQAPDYSGRENPGMDPMLGQEQRFRPAYDPGQAQRFRPPAASMAREVIQRAQNTPQAQAAQAAQVLQQSPNQLTIQKGAEQGPSSLTRFIRGDFSEGADQRIMEAMRRQREESGVTEPMARGGAAEKPKKNNKDDVLHKALEIIHHMLTRR